MSIKKLNSYLYALVLLFALMLFLVLTKKNPYGTNSLIGNFDPFPDSLHYIVPARNFVLGSGFSLSRRGGAAHIGVPPIYSLTLIPIYLLNIDARSFYFVNILLGLVSIVLLFKISQKLNKSPWLTAIVTLLYVTSFVIYWQPSLAMAENVLLPIALATIWFYLQPLNTKNLLLTTLFAVACYGSKYVTLPTTAAILLALLIKIFREKTPKEFKKDLVLVLSGAFIIFMLVNGQEVFTYLNRFIQGCYHGDVQAQEAISWFSVSYFKQSFPQYFGALMGKAIYNLWYVKPILPMGLSAIVLVWAIYTVVKHKQHDDLALLILLVVGFQLSFLSLTKMVEGRYAFIFLPFIWTGTAALLGNLREWLVAKLEKKEIYLEIVLSLVLVGSCLLINLRDLKTQLLLNFRSGETPWWQVGIQKADQFFQEQNTDEQTMVISSLSPFVWDFYQTGDYLVLPLSSNQSMIKDKIWGVDFEASQLLNFYQEQLENKREIYLDTVGFSQNDWPILDTYREAGFNLELLKEDCLGACKIYKLYNTENQ